MPRVSDMVNIDITKAKAILYEANTTARIVSKEIEKDTDFLNQCFRNGCIRTKNLQLIKKICGIDLFPCIIKEEPKPEQMEIPLAENADSFDKLCATIRECSYDRRKQSEIETTAILNALNGLTKAMERLEKLWK